MADPLPVYRSFGEMAYWHLADDSLSGSIDERASALLKIAHNSSVNVKRCKIKPLQIRAMALELVAAAAYGGGLLGSDLLHLLAWAMNVPDSFLHDPSFVLSGRDGKGQPADPELKQMAEWIEASFLARHGKQMSVNGLANEVQTRLSLEQPPSRSTIRAWRSDADYQSFVAFIADEIRSTLVA
jgi:hypothetical protein